RGRPSGGTSTASWCVMWSVEEFLRERFLRDNAHHILPFVLTADRWGWRPWTFEEFVKAQDRLRRINWLRNTARPQEAEHGEGHTLASTAAGQPGLADEGSSIGVGGPHGAGHGPGPDGDSGSPAAIGGGEAWRG